MKQFFRHMSDNLIISASNLRRSRRAARRSAGFRPQIEGLEERWCPALSSVDAWDLAGLSMSPATAVPIGTANANHGLYFNQSHLSISSTNDVDYFKFTLGGQSNAGTIDVLFSNADGDLDIRLDRLNSDGTTTYVDSSATTKDDEHINLLGKDAGTYLLKVYGYQGATNDYQIVVDEGATAAAPPPADSFPTLNPVGQQGQVGSLRPQLSWTTSNAALAYQVWLDDLTTGKTNLYPQAITGATSWAPPSDLISGHSYRFWVQGLKFNGTWPWSFPQDFTVSTVKFDAIKGPINDLYPNITWTGVQGAAGYNVWVDNLTTGQKNIFPAAQGTATGWQLDTANQNVYLVPGNEYQIWVKAVNANGAGDWSAAQHFTVGSANFAKPQTAISEVSPALPVTVLGHSSKTVLWVDDLTSGQKNLFPNQLLVGDTWLPPSDLTLGHTYRIWAEVFGPANNSVGWWGAPTDFSINTSITAIPPATTLRPNMGWSFFKGVTNYEVWVEDQAGGGNLTPGKVVSSLVWQPDFDLISGHKYTMWVRAQGGTWSASQTFEIAKVSEFDYLNAGSGKVAWTPLDGVTTYKLWIDDLTSGAKNVFGTLTAPQQGAGQKLGDNLVLPAGLITGHNYRLWIKAENASGLGEWSDPFDFTRS